MPWSPGLRAPAPPAHDEPAARRRCCPDQRAFDLRAGAAAVDWATLPGLAHCVIATIGAVALSALFHLGAIAGNDTQLVLDRSAGLATWIASSPVKKPARTTQPLGRIRGVATGATDWTDGPTYHLAITLDDGAVVAFGSSPSQANVDDARDRMARFVGV